MEVARDGKLGDLFASHLPSYSAKDFSPFSFSNIKTIAGLDGL